MVGQKKYSLDEEYFFLIAAHIVSFAHSQYKMTNYLISYDIQRNGLRQKIAKILLAAGCVRIQKSVYLAPKFHIDEIRALEQKIRLRFGTSWRLQDSLFCLPISREALDEMTWQGSEAWIDQTMKQLAFLVV